MSFRGGGGGDTKVAREPETPGSKTAVFKASPSLVGLTSSDIPFDMVESRVRKFPERYNCKYEFKGHGFIIETNKVSANSYLSTVIAPAMLFKRPNGVGVPPQQVQFDVCLSDNKLYKGKLVACDFHYNLAAIYIETSFPLRPATLKALSDVLSIDADVEVNEKPQPHDLSRFQLLPHSHLFKVRSGTSIILLRSSFSPPFSVDATCGVFRSSHSSSYSCKELCWIHCDGIDTFSGTIINLSGEVIGVVFRDSSFLPSNFISRWWNHYKSNGKFCRPWVGVEIANLAEARLSFLEKFRNTFSDISTGVIVTEVEKDTPAYCSGIRLKDVIVKCGGKQVQSKIQFFESMWDNAGRSVELTILRASDGQLLDLRMSIGETTPANFHRWPLPIVKELFDSSCLDDNSSDFDSSDGSCDELSDGAP